MSVLEDSRTQREDDIYKSLFSDMGEGIHPLDADLFTQQFNCEHVDPTWLHYGVFKCPPSGDRKTWLYVSSGMSNPVDDSLTHEYSGMGTEFILETYQECNWAIKVLQSLVAYNILLSIEHFGEQDLVNYGDRLPFKLSTDLTNLVILHPQNYPSRFELKSGKVDFLQVVGITKEELAFAQKNGSNELAKLLQCSQKSYVTDCERMSLI